MLVTLATIMESRKGAQKFAMSQSLADNISKLIKNEGSGTKLYAVAAAAKTAKYMEKDVRNRFASKLTELAIAGINVIDSESAFAELGTALVRLENQGSRLIGPMLSLTSSFNRSLRNLAPEYAIAIRYDEGKHTDVLNAFLEDAIDDPVSSTHQGKTHGKVTILKYMDVLNT